MNRPANYDPSIQRISTSTRMGSGNWKTKCEFNTETKVYDVLVTSLYGRDLPSRAHWQLLAWECIKYQILACGSTVDTIWFLIDSHHFCHWWHPGTDIIRCPTDQMIRCTHTTDAVVWAPPNVTPISNPTHTLEKLNDIRGESLWRSVSTTKPNKLPRRCWSQNK